MGTLTFLLTDIEGSTWLWDRHPEDMARALQRHDAIVASLVQRHGGRLVKARGEGDSMFVVFADPCPAVRAALALQVALREEDWPPQTPIAVRVGIDTGPVESRDGDFYGTTVNRAARVRASAHGGQVVVSGHTAELVGADLPPGAALHDLGLFEFAGLQASERIFELRHPELPQIERPVKALPASRHNVRASAEPVIGREEAIEEVLEALDGARLVTLTGPGGIGKTTVAEQVAVAMAERCRDGAWFVELGALTDGALIPGAVAGSLGVREEAGRPLWETLSGHLRGREVLVVLDNCEHLVEAAAASAERLLAGAAGLRVLATAREPLGVMGEVILPLAPLATPRPGAHTVDEVLAAPAAALFARRATRARPGFAVTDENAAAVGDICRRVDGLALAIELAAGRVSVLEPAQIAERLQDRFRLLVGGERTRPRRQRTLLAAVEWSHDLLDDADRVLFRRLAVFADTFDLAAAEQVCGGEGADPLPAADVLDGLASLVAKSLLAAVPTGRRMRYAMLQTIRDYAAGRLARSGEEDAIRDRHAQWCMRLAEAADHQLTTSHEQERCIDRLEEVHDDLRAALAWSVERSPGSALAMAGALALFWSMRGHLREGRSWLERTLSAASSAPPPDQVRALNGASLLSLMSGDIPAAERLAQRALSTASAAGDVRGRARALHELGNQRAFSDPLGAVGLLEESVRAAEDVGDVWSLVDGLLLLGLVRIFAGDPHAAREALERSRQAAEERGHAVGAAIAQIALGYVEHRQGRLVEAELTLNAGLGRSRARSHGFNVARALIDLGMVDVDRGRLGLAAGALAEARMLVEETAGIFSSSVQGALGRLALARGDVDDADRHFRAALAAAAENQMRFELGWWHQGLGEVAVARDAFDRAWASFADAHAEGRSLGNPFMTGAALCGMASVALGRDADPSRARALLREAIELLLPVEARLTLVQAVERRAQAALMSGDADLAVLLIAAAAAARERLGYVAGSVEARLLADDEQRARASMPCDRFGEVRRAGTGLSLERAAAIACDREGFTTPAPRVGSRFDGDLGGG